MNAHSAEKKFEDICFYNLESWPVHSHWSIVHSLPPLLACRPFSWHQQPSTKPNPTTNRTKNITWSQQPSTTKPSHLQIFNYNIILLPHLMIAPTPDVRIKAIHLYTHPCRKVQTCHFSGIHIYHHPSEAISDASCICKTSHLPLIKKMSATSMGF